MTRPSGFSWIDPPFLAASAMPYDREELQWLRQQGIDILLSLSEEPPSHKSIDDAGLMLVHVPVPDFEAPTRAQFEKCLTVIQRGQQSSMGVNIHCRAGKGRTGTVLAAYFVSKGMYPHEAIQHVRDLRPGSIETPEQEQAVVEFARQHRTDQME